MKVFRFIKYLFHYRSINSVDTTKGWYWDEKLEYWETPHYAEKPEYSNWE